MSKVTVSLPDELIQEIDKEAHRRSMSRSDLLAESARRELARPDSVAVDKVITRSERRFRNAGSFEATELLRRDRDSRR